MVSERDLIAVEHSERLRELYFLVSSALQPLPDFKYSSASTSATNFFDRNEISSNKSFLITSIPKVRNQDTLKRQFAANAQVYMYQTEGNVGRGKRPNETAVSSTNKRFKTLVNSTPSGISRPFEKDRKTQMSQNLLSQIKCVERETNDFLQKRISDLDIVTMPVSYPTQVHNSTSLAELYYLTQTFPLFKLLPGSHKALMTEHYELALLEGKIAVLYSRIEELKRQNKWSLRQPMRYYDPFLYCRRNKKTKELTWDSVVREAKWMAADFKELHKFRKYCCARLAQAVREFWIYGKDVCIKTKPLEHLSENQEEELTHADEQNEIDNMDIPDANEQVPMEFDEDIEGSLKAENESTTDETIASKLEMDDEAAKDDSLKPLETPSSDLSKLLAVDESEDDFLFELQEDTPEPPQAPTSQGPFKSHININDLTKLDQSILRNLPKYTAFGDDPLALATIPVTETSIIPTLRMLYPEEQDNEWYKVVLRNSAGIPTPNEESGAPPYQKGLFGVQSQRKFNFLKPPKPPLLKNIKYRSPTIWLPRDDQFLIHYVAEYCFNWELISASLQSQTATLQHYASNIEKRTPWQCFERYIQLNDKFQFRDMKGPNASPAQAWLEEAHNAQMSTKRRISPLGVGIESIQRGHKKLRWASMFDAMRKTMRRREVTAAKANSRKATTPEYSSSTSSGAEHGSGKAPKRQANNASTPQELSRLKHDRDKAIQEAYFQRQASRTRLKSGIAQGQIELTDPCSLPAPVGPMDPNSSRPSRATLEAQRRMRQQRSVQGSSTESGRPTSAGPQSVVQSGIANQLSHVALAQQQAKQLIGSMKTVLPNAKGFTHEQMQKAVQFEKQRFMLQQQNLMGGSSGALSPRLSGQIIPGRKTLDSAGSPTMLGAGASITRSPTTKQAGLAIKDRLPYQSAQFAAIVNTIQQKDPSISKEQAKKVAALYLVNLQQQQQASRAAQGTVSNAQDALKVRQAQMAAREAAAAENEDDAQGLKQEERGKMVFTQDIYPTRGSASPYTRTTSRANSPMDKSLQYPTNDKS